MNHKANVSREPLNVLGCQWPGADEPDFPKSASAYLMGAKAGHGTSTASSSSVEAMDLKLDNERRLHELREQGRQCLLNRNEQNTKEEGAANVVVRFHTMPWINNPLNPLSELAAGNSRPNRAVNYSQVNLVPVKHDEEEEYFPGTRQQKRARRPKNVRAKCETIKLEEVPPGPKDKIFPAGFVPPVNAWTVRRGSELFESRKLSLTLYGPDNEDALYQRALQESIVTLYEEQDRIVNMFSSYHGDNSGPASSGFEEPKEEIEAPAAQASGAGGAGDGSWVKSGRSRNGTMVDTASESEDLGKGRCLDAGDSAYSRNSSLENNGNGKTQSDKNNIEYDIKKSAKEENKEAKLESLGFNKSRAAQFARRETLRKREDKRNGEKRQLQKPFVSSDSE
ncbi:hypothetical protein R5R35_004177 [Gryllus longicercus]|uniref:Uncharacterized protein n=1 Tax=Gryllus longicercus TaxID=2509291 RepID=A0AAN9V382_9ORTH